MTKLSGGSRFGRRPRCADDVAAAYFYTPDRRGKRPRAHLAGFSGFLQADGYLGYDQLYDGRRQPGAIVEVACWAHVRRKICDVWKGTGSTGSID